MPKTPTNRGGPFGSRAKRRFDSVDDFEEWLHQITAPVRMSRQRCYAGGNRAALYDALASGLDAALDRPEQDAVPIPRWALEAILSDWVALLRVERRWIASWRRDEIDWQRYRQVYYRSIGRREGSPPRPKPKAARVERRAFEAVIRERRRKSPEGFHGSGVDMWTPYPWHSKDNNVDPDVFEAVSRLFQEMAPYAGTRDEIKKSWERVTAALKKGESWRYYPSRWLRHDPRQIETADKDLPR